MQDRYVADFGDFGKYGLLRALAGGEGEEPRVSLGVVWYRVSDEGEAGTGDGKFTGYLEPTPENLDKFRGCDPDLYDGLARLLRKKRRCVEAVREEGILPRGTRCWERLLTYEGLPLTWPERKEARIRAREAWLDGALEETRGCDLVFLDPDNGLESGARPWQKTGPKFAYYEELRAFRERDQSLVVYHHACRQGTAEEQAERGKEALRKSLGLAEAPLALVYRRGTVRTYFVIPAAAQEGIVRGRIERFLAGNWGRHFESAPAPRSPA